MAELFLPRPGPRTREWARRHGFDAWRVARLARLVPEPGTFLEGLLHPAPEYVRVNPLRAEVSEVRKRLAARGFALAATDLDPYVLQIRDAPISAGATQEHLLGYTTPQDLASAAAPLALAARPGDVVVDIAAAPGVKTLHVAADLAGAAEDAPDEPTGEGVVVAIEPDAKRMRGLRFNLERCGATNAVLRMEPGQEVPGEAWADKVLLDTPCTGEGTLPKDRSRRRGAHEEITRLATLQSELLDAAHRVLRPGGTLVYATCALAPEENEFQVQRMVEQGYEVLPLPFDACGGRPLVHGLTTWGEKQMDPAIALTRRFLPGIHPTLGFYVAKLQKPGGTP